MANPVATEYVAHDVLSIIAYHECGGDFATGVVEKWGTTTGDYPVLPADNARSIARVKDRLFVGFADAGVAEIDLADKADVEKHYTSSSDPDVVGDDIYSMTGSLVVGSRSRGATKLRLDWLRGDDPNAEVTEYTYNEANELVSLIEDSEDVITFGYDANGNMVSRSGPVGNTTYTYNTWDRLVAVNTAGGKSVAYGYDVNGLRVLSEDETGERSRYLLDGVHVLAKFDEVGSEQKMWATYNPTRVDEILSALTPERGKQHYHLDGLVSVTAISDGVQRLMQAERYLAWGGSNGSQGNVDQPFMFTGRELERATGLQYNRKRWLDSSTGRWTRRDPINSPHNLMQEQTYGYVDARPTRSLDPSGLSGSGIRRKFVTGIEYLSNCFEDACEGWKYFGSPSQFQFADINVEYMARQLERWWVVYWEEKDDNDNYIKKEWIVDPYFWAIFIPLGAEVSCEAAIGAAVIAQYLAGQMILYPAAVQNGLAETILHEWVHHSIVQHQTNPAGWRIWPSNIQNRNVKFRGTEDFPLEEAFAYTASGWTDQ